MARAPGLSPSGATRNEAILLLPGSIRKHPPVSGCAAARRNCGDGERGPGAAIRWDVSRIIWKSGHRIRYTGQPPPPIQRGFGVLAICFPRVSHLVMGNECQPKVALCNTYLTSMVKLRRGGSMVMATASAIPLLDFSLIFSDLRRALHSKGGESGQRNEEETFSQAAARAGRLWQNDEKGREQSWRTRGNENHRL